MDYPLVIKSDTKASEVIDHNPMMLLMFEHFKIPLGLQDKTILQVCNDAGIEESLFLVIANLFNGIYPTDSDIETISDIRHIIRYLDQSHKHYVNEKFPLLTSYINEICKINIHPEIELLKRFLDDYLDEVADHLKYENTVVFPYVLSLINDQADIPLNDSLLYSMSDYSGHHDDIEEKLIDLKNLLIRYLPPHNDMAYRRKLLLTLGELEFDLHIHSLIEETLLIPIVERLEKTVK